MMNSVLIMMMETGVMVRTGGEGEVCHQRGVFGVVCTFSHCLGGAGFLSISLFLLTMQNHAHFSVIAVLSFSRQDRGTRSTSLDLSLIIIILITITIIISQPLPLPLPDVHD